MMVVMALIMTPLMLPRYSVSGKMVVITVSISVEFSGENNNFDVLDEVGYGIAVRFYQLGQSLRIHKADLDIIRSQYKDAPKDGLSEVIDKWLAQSYNVAQYGEPTWKVLAKAVAHRFGGSNCAVARKIAKEHPVPTSQADSS